MYFEHEVIHRMTKTWQYGFSYPNIYYINNTLRYSNVNCMPKKIYVLNFDHLLRVIMLNVGAMSKPQILI